MCLRSQETTFRSLPACPCHPPLTALVLSAFPPSLYPLCIRSPVSAGLLDLQGSNPGRLFAYGDASCLDSAHQTSNCFGLLERVLKFAAGGERDADLLMEGLKLQNALPVRKREGERDARARDVSSSAVQCSRPTQHASALPPLQKKRLQSAFRGLPLCSTLEPHAGCPFARPPRRHGLHELEQGAREESTGGILTGYDRKGYRVFDVRTSAVPRH